MTKQQAAINALRMLDMGPDYLVDNFNRIRSNLIGKVNWRRDGF